MEASGRPRQPVARPEAPPAPQGSTFEEGYAAGVRDGSLLVLQAEADKLQAIATRATGYPEVVAAMNEATAILRDAASELAARPGPRVGQRVERPAATRNGRAPGTGGGRAAR